MLHKDCSKVIKMARDKNIRETMMHGFSVHIALTGFAPANKKYRIEKMTLEGKERIVLTEVSENDPQ